MARPIKEILLREQASDNTAEFQPAVMHSLSRSPASICPLPAIFRLSRGPRWRQQRDRKPKVLSSSASGRLSSTNGALFVLSFVTPLPPSPFDIEARQQQRRICHWRPPSCCNSLVPRALESERESERDTARTQKSKFIPEPGRQTDRQACRRPACQPARPTDWRAEEQTKRGLLYVHLICRAG